MPYGSGQPGYHGKLCDGYYANDSHVSGNKFTTIFNNFTAVYADDLAAAGPINNLRNGMMHYVDLVQNLVVILKEVSHSEERAKSIFKHTNVKITTEGKMHLGGVTRTKNYRQNYMKEKIDQWITEFWMLCKIAWYEPQPACSRFITEFQHKPTYLIQTVPKL